MSTDTEPAGGLLAAAVTEPPAGLLGLALRWITVDNRQALRIGAFACATLHEADLSSALTIASEYEKWLYGTTSESDGDTALGIICLHDACQKAEAKASTQQVTDAAEKLYKWLITGELRRGWFRS